MALRVKVVRENLTPKANGGIGTTAYNKRGELWSMDCGAVCALDESAGPPPEAAPQVAS